MRLAASRARPGSLLLALMGCCALLAAACSSSEPEAGPTATVGTTPPTEATTTTAAATTTTTTALNPEEEVQAAYLAAQNAFYKASLGPDPDDPALAATTAGPGLEAAEDLLTQAAQEGIRVEFANGEPPVTIVTKVTLEADDVAIVDACTIDDARQVRAADDEVLNDSIESRLNRAEMRLSDGEWLLYTQEGLERWSDGKGCDR